MVHLSSVRLRGFKSFAKPTELTFEPGVTVIIGPNGSGKSNIADAVLWVLGEQSPGNLRGQAMHDVIFSGAAGRKSSAVAEVSLVFDCGGDELSLDYEQVEITRRLTRDTGSEYRLNGNVCRLLDIQDLVGGWGLGREMHSIVGQGKVEALLNSTPEARRALVEEAAGLARFKKRRERAQSKLEQTQQNLMRLADIEREVGSALRPLRQQVAAAERFAEAAEQWALAKSRLTLHRLVEAREACAKMEEESRRLEAQRMQVEAALSDLRCRRVEEQQQFEAALEIRERVTAAYHQVRGEVERLDSRAVALRQRLARLDAELERGRRRLALAREEVASLTARLQATAADTGDEARLGRVRRWSEALRTALENLTTQYRDAVAHEDDLKDELFELEAARSRTLQDREFLQREVEERRRIEAQLTAMAAESAGRVEELESKAGSLRVETALAQERSDHARRELDEALARREAAQGKVDEIALREAAVREALAGVEARTLVLADILSRREGAPAGVRALLETVKGCRALTDVLAVEPGYERAVAAALGPLAEGVVLPATYGPSGAFGTEGVFEAIREAEEEAPLRRRKSVEAPPAGARDLWEIVSGPQRVIDILRDLLPPTAVLGEESQWERAMAAGKNDSWQLVNLEGELVQGSVYAARRRNIGAEAPLRARNELERATKEGESLRRELDAVQEAATQAASARREAEAMVQHQADNVRKAERHLAGLEEEIGLVERRLEEARLQEGEIQIRRQGERDAADEMLVQLLAVEESIKEREAALESARAGLRRYQAEVETLRSAVARQQEKKRQAVLLEVKLQERCRSRQAEQGRIRAQCEAAEKESAQWQWRVRSLELYRPVVMQLLAVVERLAERAGAIAVSLQSEVDAARAASEVAVRRMHERGGEEDRLQREYDLLAGRLADLRVEEARLGDQRAVLENELAELRRRHRSPRLLTDADVKGVDSGALEAAVERAQRRRDKVGPVNPLAEVECAQMEERAAFLAEQRRDLQSSLSRLQEIVRGLDEHIEQTFTEVFEATRENFSAVIASVFPGAKGSLKLTGATGKRTASRVERRRATTDPEPGVDLVSAEDDLCEQEQQRERPGIALEVKFPNKSPRSLSLLSGGEKAMTAIAFLFALFLARPCPFYILDEVEASLDDINIRRFLSLVRKYRDKTQFIIITHQHQTMEVADTLYGVTLEKDGTSRVLSRRLAIAKGA